MFKLIKYEFRKNIVGISIVLGIIFGLQLYFTISYLMENDNHAGIAVALLYLASIVCFFIVYVFGINTYSKELSSKTGYLIFMTPNSAFKIVAAKYIFTFLVGSLILVVLLVFGILDLNMLVKFYDEEVDFIKMFMERLEAMGVDVMEIVYTFTGAIVEFLIVFFMIMSIAYFSITLTATVLQNRKFKGIISVIVFIVLFVITVKIDGLLPVIYESPNTLLEELISVIPSAVYCILVLLGGMIGTAKLLEKKVSL